MRPNCGHKVEIAHTPFSAYLSTFKHLPQTSNLHDLMTVPMNTSVSRRLLRQVRPWIEPAQSYEKNQLGLSQVFLNSLRLTWTMCLLADAAVLLRAHTLLRRPPPTHPLQPMLPTQLTWQFDD